MKHAPLTLFALLIGAALLIALPPHFAAEAKKSLAEQLELLNLAILLEQHNRPFSAEELEQLRRAIPSVKKSNPKLYKDTRQTEQILLLYMILDQIEHATEQGNALSSLVGKSRGQLARDYVERVYNSK